MNKHRRNRLLSLYEHRYHKNIRRLNNVLKKWNETYLKYKDKVNEETPPTK